LGTTQTHCMVWIGAFALFFSDPHASFWNGFEQMGAHHSLVNHWIVCGSCLCGPRALF